ncbi:ORF17 [turkey adenovirus 4]|uniref:ORF17 n=1 Tax=turkey adenovirus 4 TaxID=1408257 RepID=U5NHQ1_9ADEN|nr:ORF17 [Turkey aviadenovirus 4]AGX93322.1 ORF17 [Turkey aviadenovirus 4]
MPLYLVFGVAVPPWCQREEVFWKLVREVKAVWRPFHESANRGVGYPMGYCIGLQPGGSCRCHLTLLVCLTMFDLRAPHLFKCSRILKRYFREQLYYSEAPKGEWFRMYTNLWCANPGHRVGKFVVSSDAVLDICGWIRCTGLRYSDTVYPDERHLF